MTLFYISAVLALLLAGFVLTLKQRRAAHLFFAASLAVLAVLNGVTAAFGADTPLVISFLKIGFAACLPALLFLHVRHLLRPQMPLRASEIVHFGAPLAAVVLPRLDLAQGYLSPDAVLFGIWGLYALLAFREVFTGRRGEEVETKPSVRLWSRLVCAWLAGVAITDLSLAMIESEARGGDISKGFLVAGFLVITSVGAVLFASLHRADVLGWLLERKPQRTARPDDLIDRLEVGIRNSRAYLDPNLSLQRFARQMQLPQRVVSDEINEARGRNFRSWVNSFRIEEAQRLMREDNSRNVTDVFLDAGFQTKSTFNAAFKAETGLSPSAWRAQIA
ncbi:AraC family transcriptional regulator [Roseibium sp. SCP14]|uniref:AraC family transcriptional regulator n=1 Tax=Roseibium sp. SCP14 TaxID=3141375 RepID=UPI003338D7F8